MTRPATSNYLKGAVFGLAAVAIWAGWSVMTRLAVTTSLDAWDIAALRYGVAGLILVPILLQHGLARDRLGLLGLAVSLPGRAHLTRWWRRAGCALPPLVIRAPSIPAACQCSLL